MDGQSEPRVWDARFQYYYKKKKAKLQILSQIIRKKVKQKEEEANKRRAEEEARYHQSKTGGVPLLKMGSIKSFIIEKEPVSNPPLLS